MSRLGNRWARDRRKTGQRLSRAALILVAIGGAQSCAAVESKARGLPEARSGAERIIFEAGAYVIRPGGVEPGE